MRHSFFSYIIHTRIYRYRPVAYQTTVPSRIEWKEIRSIGWRGKKHLVCRRVADKRVSKWERNEGKKYLSQGVCARVCVRTQLAITTAIKRSTRPARFNVSIAIFIVGIACTPGGHLSTLITHPTTRFEWRKLARFLNNTRGY